MCPDGLHFNPVARYPAYPCAYPTEVKCQIPSIKRMYAFPHKRLCYHNTVQHTFDKQAII